MKIAILSDDQPSFLKPMAVSISKMLHETGVYNDPALYAPIGRPSIPPEKLLRAMLLQAFYSIRSERQLMEQLEYDLLFR